MEPLAAVAHAMADAVASAVADAAAEERLASTSADALRIGSVAGLDSSSSHAGLSADAAAQPHHHDGEHPVAAAVAHAVADAMVDAVADAAAHDSLAHGSNDSSNSMGAGAGVPVLVVGTPAASSLMTAAAADAMEVDSRDLLAGVVAEAFAQERADGEMPEDADVPTMAARSDSPHTPTSPSAAATLGGSPAVSGLANMPFRKSAHITSTASEAAHAFVERLMHAGEAAAGPADAPRSPRVVIQAVGGTDAADDDWESVDPAKAAEALGPFTSSDALAIARGPAAAADDDEDDDDEDDDDDDDDEDDDEDDDDDDEDDDDENDVLHNVVGGDDDDEDDFFEDADAASLDEDETVEAQQAALSSLADALAATSVVSEAPAVTTLPADAGACAGAPPVLQPTPLTGSRRLSAHQATARPLCTISKCAPTATRTVRTRSGRSGLLPRCRSWRSRRCCHAVSGSVCSLPSPTAPLTFASHRLTAASTHAPCTDCIARGHRPRAQRPA